MFLANQCRFRSGASLGTFLNSRRKPVTALVCVFVAIGLFHSGGSARCFALSSNDVSNARLTPLSIQKDEPKVTLLTDETMSGAEVIAKHSGNKMGSLCFVVRRPG